MSKIQKTYVCGHSQKNFTVEPGDVDEHGWWHCAVCDAHVRVTFQPAHVAETIWVPLHRWLGVDVGGAA